MKEILIVGGSGFVGTNLINILSFQYPTTTIYNLDIILTSYKSIAQKNIDIRQKITTNQLPSSIDCIINLAAVHKSPGHPTHEYFETNILGARNVCEFAEKVGCKKIIFTSSIAPYGPGEDEKTENSLTMPNIPYGISKIIAEGIHKEWMLKGEGRRLFILRPGVIFGKGEKGNFTRMATALRKGIFAYPGRKDTIKACVYVKDVCRVIDFCMSREEQFNIFNVCYPQKITTEQVAQAFHEAVGYKIPKIVVPRSVLNTAAGILRIFNTPFIRSLGLDPERIAKLVNSTNISSKKLVEAGFEFKYDLVSAIKDWSGDCGGGELR